MSVDECVVVVRCFIIVEGLLLDEYVYEVGSRWDGKESSEALVKNKLIIWVSRLNSKERP